MIKLSKRSTIYIDPKMHKILKYKSLETSRSISDLVNEAIRHEFLEDAEDLQAFEERVNEKTITYEELVKKLKSDGKL